MKIDLRKNIKTWHVVSLIIVYVLCMSALLFWHFFVSDEKLPVLVSKVNENKTEQCYRSFNQDEVDRELEKHRVCEVASDCAVIPGEICTFQRSTVVEVQYVETAKKIMNPCGPPMRDSSCHQSFILPVIPVCVNHQCQLEVDGPLPAGNPPI